MPDPGDFLNGFNLHKGLILANYTLNRITILHNQIIRYRKYEYPITLVFHYNNTNEIDNDYQNLYHELINLIQGEKIIYSRYGNPYSCSISFESAERDSNNDIIIKLMGHSHRV
jgi:hypothetical protein